MIIAKKQLDSGYIDDWLDIELQKKAGILLDAYYTQEELDALSEEVYKEVFHQAEICALGTTLSLDCFQNNSERAVERFNKLREGLVTACQLVTLAVVLSNPGTALAGFAAAGNGVVGVADGAVWVSQGEEKTGIYEIGFSMLDIYGGLKILDETTGLKNLIEPIKNNKGCINYFPERSGADDLAGNVGKKVSETRVAILQK